jgi:hypothetical protein
MNKIAAMFFMAVFLHCMLTHSARPEPPFQKESLVVTQHDKVGSIFVDTIYFCYLLHNLSYHLVVNA